MKKAQALVIIIIILVLIVIAGYFILTTTKKNPASPKTDGIAKETGGVNGVIETETTQEETQTETKENIVEVTSSGFSPQSLTISQGTVVTFINKGSALSWPASAVHSTHKIYPENTGKCSLIGGSDFDACKGLKQEEIYSFIFNEKGSWRYHDHLDPSSTGIIVVE